MLKSLKSTQNLKYYQQKSHQLTNNTYISRDKMYWKSSWENHLKTGKKAPYFESSTNKPS